MQPSCSLESARSMYSTYIIESARRKLFMKQPSTFHELDQNMCKNLESNVFVLRRPKCV